MNRRGFFSTLAKAAAGFTILPAAATYSRIWRVQRPEFLIVDSFTGFEGIDSYNKLPFWYALNYAAKDIELARIFWKKYHTKLSSSFPYNMGEVISTVKQTNQY